MGNVHNVHGNPPDKPRPLISGEEWWMANELLRILVMMRAREQLYTYGDATRFCIRVMYAIANNLYRVYTITGRNDIGNLLNEALEDFTQGLE